MSELKPCPFCGGDADLDWCAATDIGGSLVQTGYVYCTNAKCDATIDITSIDDEFSDCDLINKWNTRAEPQEPKTLHRQNAELVEAVRFVTDTFKKDLDAGYKTRDKEFAFDVLSDALSKIKGDKDA